MLRPIPVLGLAVALLSACASTLHTPPSVHEINWDTVPSSLARIQAPTFPARGFAITDHSAVAGGADCTAAIAKAIAAAHAADGGRAVVPAGVFHTGAVT